MDAASAALSLSKPTEDRSVTERPDAPRRALPITVRELWATTPSDSDSIFVLPNDLWFTPHGLLVIDAADRVIHVIDGASGRVRRSIGRGGDGPGELHAGMRFLGTAAAPMLFDQRSRKFVRLVGDSLTPRSAPMTAKPSWITMCAVGPDETLGSVLGREGFEFLLTHGGEVVDSLPTPWPELLVDDFLIRQATVQQLTDSTCIMTTVYRAAFATFQQGRTTIRGNYVEALPRTSATVTRDTAAKATWHTVPRGSVPGPTHAAMRRDFVVLAFHGRSTQRDRVLDLYRASDLSYHGSIVFPFIARRIAVSGDTLAIIGEQDDLPFLAAYILRPESPPRR